jgi:uncharacterized protein YyaL (SSP411 family)
MDAVQAMTGSGGWPLNVFLTPDQKPFYGGTYFPPQRAFNRPSWQEVLINVKDAFRLKRHEIDAQAENLTEHLVQSNSFGIQPGNHPGFYAMEKADELFQNIMKSADRVWGGFGRAPKFPQTSVVLYLLRYYYVTKNEDALKQALLSIDKMINGGIYDQVGGGFARYSTDAEWLVPHFEKMIYDNALLVSILSEAFQLTKNNKYREVIDETIQFVRRELMHDESGFYSAIDADSEGEEGKFYVWQYEEVKAVLKDKAELFSLFFDITPEGNWDHKNILWRQKSEEIFCKENNITLPELEKIIADGKENLLAERNKRIRPQTDDKLLLSWNALMNTAISKAFAATGNEGYRQLAIRNMNFILQNFSIENSEAFFHVWKNGIGRQPAFLDDYAFLIQALIQLQEITGNPDYLIKAKNITEYVFENFSEPVTGYFFYIAKHQQDVIVRKKEVYDGAQPSGNAVMADNLYRLSLFFDITNWKKQALKITESLGNAIIRYPASFGAWSCLYLEIVAGTNEIVVIENDINGLYNQLLVQFIPHKILMNRKGDEKMFPLLANKNYFDKPAIYLCRNSACEKPVETVNELMGLLKANELKIS